MPGSFLRLSYYRLPCNIREQSYKPGALDGYGELALVLGTDARALTAEDAAVWIEKFL